MNEFDLELSSQWVRSVDSDSAPGLTGIAIDAVRDIQRRSYYAEASSRDKRRIETALTGTPKWIYTSERVTDGLWDEELPTRMAPMNVMSRFVISGALGDALVEHNPRLLEQAECFAHSSLNKLIVIGGAAVYGYQHYYRKPLELNGSYESNDPDVLLRWTTSTGGDIHGDFRAQRYARPIYGIFDTVNPELRQHFMPAIYESRTMAYHGSEIGIVAGLLFHLVAHENRDAIQLKNHLHSMFEGEKGPSVGPFADFGDDDGSMDAARLRLWLEDPDHKKGVLYKNIFSPDAPALKFRMDSEDNGVSLRVVNEEESTIVHEMNLQNDEIESFIVNLILSGGGRTSPQAMVKVIDALG